MTKKETNISQKTMSDQFCLLCNGQHPGRKPPPPPPAAALCNAGEASLTQYSRLCGGLVQVVQLVQLVQLPAYN